LPGSKVGFAGSDLGFPGSLFLGFVFVFNYFPGSFRHFFVFWCLRPLARRFAVVVGLLGQAITRFLGAGGGFSCKLLDRGAKLVRTFGELTCVGLDARRALSAALRTAHAWEKRRRMRSFDAGRWFLRAIRYRCSLEKVARAKSRLRSVT
jgi:hypothetical protein